MPEDLDEYHDLQAHMEGDIDLDAGRVLDGSRTLAQVGEEIYDFLIEIERPRDLLGAARQPGIRNWTRPLIQTAGFSGYVGLVTERVTCNLHTDLVGNRQCQRREPDRRHEFGGDGAEERSVAVAAGAVDLDRLSERVSEN